MSPASPAGLTPVVVREISVRADIHRPINKLVAILRVPPTGGEVIIGRPMSSNFIVALQSHTGIVCLEFGTSDIWSRERKCAENYTK